METTIADILKDEGRREGAKKAAVKVRQQILVRQLGKRFGDIPGELLAEVKSAAAVRQLDAWLDRLATADTLDELEIPVAE